MKKFSTLLFIKEMQRKTTVRYHFVTTMMVMKYIYIIIKKMDNNKCWQRCKKLEPSYVVGGNVK